MAWNILDLETKKNYLKKQLLQETDPKKKEVIVNSLVIFKLMLPTSGSVKYTHFYNAMNILTLNRLHLIQSNKITKLIDNVFEKRTIKYSYDELTKIDQILFDLAKNISTDSIETENLQKVVFDELALVNLAKDFYQQLDAELFKNVETVLDDKNEAINFSKTNYKAHGVCGTTFNDNYFDKTYCNINLKDSYMDVITTNHELMHTNQYYFNKGLMEYQYPLAAEIAPKVIEMLTYDYLKINGYDQVEIDKVAYNHKFQTILMAGLAVSDLWNLKENSPLEQANHHSSSFNYNLMTAYTSLVAKYIYDEIKLNKELGMAKLKKTMTDPLMHTDKLDFNFIGLDQATLQRIACEYNDDFINQKNKYHR